MKRIITALLLLACLLTFAACGNAERPVPKPANEGNETTATSAAIIADTTADTTVAQENDPPARGQWGIRVTFVTSEEEAIPHAELFYAREMVDFGSGTKQSIVRDGALMFISVTKQLPAFAAEIPAVKWNGGDFMLRYEMDEDVTYRGGTSFSVYDEDFNRLCKSISKEELIHRSNNEWKGKTVYLEFGGVFYHPYSEEITEDLSNAYFVKTTF